MSICNALDCGHYHHQGPQGNCLCGCTSMSRREATPEEQLLIKLFVDPTFT